jgi:hypothetical protein
VTRFHLWCLTLKVCVLIEQLLDDCSIQAVKVVCRLALRPGRPRKHLGLKLFNPLCAACNLFFLRHLQGRLCCSRACGPLTGGPRTARSHRSHTEPSISEEGKYLFPPVIDRGTAPLRACCLLEEEPRNARAKRSPLSARKESFGREMAD